MSKHEYPIAEFESLLQTREGARSIIRLRSGELEQVVGRAIHALFDPEKPTELPEFLGVSEAEFKGRFWTYLPVDYVNGLSDEEIAKIYFRHEHVHSQIQRAYQAAYAVCGSLENMGKRYDRAASSFSIKLAKYGVPSDNGSVDDDYPYDLIVRTELHTTGYKDVVKDVFLRYYNLYGGQVSALAKNLSIPKNTLRFHLIRLGVHKSRNS